MNGAQGSGEREHGRECQGLVGGDWRGDGRGCRCRLGSLPATLAQEGPEPLSISVRVRGRLVAGDSICFVTCYKLMLKGDLEKPKSEL